MTHHALPRQGRPPTPPAGRAGFTLVEVLLASAVLAVAVAGLSQAIVSGQAQTQDAARSLRAVALAEAMMDEVLALPYVDLGGDTAPGPDSGEGPRGTFDGMDDFHGYAEPAGTLHDATGIPYPLAYQGFDRSVSVAYQSLNVPLLGGARAGLRIVVMVSDAGGGRSWTIERFVAQPTGVTP